MSDDLPEKEDGAAQEAAEGFRLRPERPKVMRLSRKVLAGLTTPEEVIRATVGDAD